MSESLLEELGIDSENFRWQNLALCSGMDTETFYDNYESSESVAKAADDLCLSCPVMSQCFFAGSKGETGLWGGVYWNGAGNPDKNKNRHKTEEDWDAVYRRVR